MAESISLLDFLLRLINDEDLREEFAEDPEGTLADYNLNDLTAQDVQDALILAQDNHTASFDRHYDTGFNTVPPVPAHTGHHDEGHGGHDSHKEAVEYINKYITNNYIDDRDTIVDNSVNQNIDNRGGYFDQDIDIDSTVASGDGAVAAGDDIVGSDVVTGDGNIVGDHNDVVQGDGNTVAFDGNATSTDIHDVDLDDGSALAVNGSATTTDNDTTTTVGNFGEGDTAVNVAGAGGTASQISNQAEDNSTTEITTNAGSFNEDNDHVEDSFQSDDDFELASNNEIASDNEDNDGFDDKDLIDVN